jgi:RimJ/RimL family protein N-acetyltransferase
VVEIITDRLILRSWQESDLAPWAVMNADPLVREHLGPLLTAEDAAASVREFQAGLVANGFGFWAVQVRSWPSTGVNSAPDSPFIAIAGQLWRPVVPPRWRPRTRRDGFRSACGAYVSGR